jgi:hypothetical protein
LSEALYQISLWISHEWSYLFSGFSRGRYGYPFLPRIALTVSAIEEPASISRPALEWRSIWAGAIAAAGVSFALHAFATGIGLSVLSTAPTWRDSSPIFWLLSAIYLVFVALAGFGLGGYIAGRMRRPLVLAGPEQELSDGIHGLVTWALVIILTAVLALGAAATASSAIAPAGGQAGASQSVAGENIIATELDELFWTVRPLHDDITYRRAEAARILLKSSSHEGVPARDREYLASVVSVVTGLPADAAKDRVDREIAAAKVELQRARTAAVLQAFFIAAALFVGAAVAWFASCEGGRERDTGYVPLWDWSFRRRDFGRPAIRS